MGVIQIEGMEFYAFHGCYKEEQIVGNKFLVDLYIEADCAKASLSDDINDAVNYQTAYNIVKKQVEIKSHLLEHVANRILENLFAQMTQISFAKVKVCKINPPMGGKIQQVSVTLSRQIADIQ